MDTSRFQSIRKRLSSHSIRASFRRSSSSSTASSASSSSAASFHSAVGYTSIAPPMSPAQQRDSIASASSIASSPADTINAVLFRQPSIADLEAEKRSSGVAKLVLLEPRPIVYWGGVEERMGDRSSYDGGDVAPSDYAIKAAEFL